MKDTVQKLISEKYYKIYGPLPPPILFKGTPEHFLSAPNVRQYMEMHHIFVVCIFMFTFNHVSKKLIKYFKITALFANNPLTKDTQKENMTKSSMITNSNVRAENFQQFRRKS
jgi:hypothetical protein